MTTPKKRGPAPGTGGRPKGPDKVVLTCRVLPSTKAALGKSPGAMIDKLAKKLKPKIPMPNINAETLKSLAAMKDCAIITGSDNDYALLKRHYDAEGIEQVRHAPDPCDFFTMEEWMSADAEKVLKMIC